MIAGQAEDEHAERDGVEGGRGRRAMAAPVRSKMWPRERFVERGILGEDGRKVGAGLRVGSGEGEEKGQVQAMRRGEGKEEKAVELEDDGGGNGSGPTHGGRRDEWGTGGGRRRRRGGRRGGGARGGKGGGASSTPWRLERVKKRGGR